MNAYHCLCAFSKVIWVKTMLSGLILSCLSFKNVFFLIDTGGGDLCNIHNNSQISVDYKVIPMNGSAGRGTGSSPARAPHWPPIPR